MKMQMLGGQVFCLGKWSEYSNSLEIGITAEYSDGRPNVTEKADLINKKASVDGLIIIIDSGNFYIGSEPENIVTKFTLQLNNPGVSLRVMQLEYAFAKASDAFNNNVVWNDEPLFSDKLEFFKNDMGYAVKMSMTDYEPSAYTPPNELLSHEPAEMEKYDMEDIIGDMEKDMIILSYYKGDTIKNAISKLNEMIISGNASWEQKEEHENLLRETIGKTQEDIRRYRSSLLEYKQFQEN